MSAQQALAFAVIGGAVALFAWGRFRYDLVALGALLVGLATGLVPAKEAFTGFTSDVVVIIATALIVSAAIARSGVIELFLQPLLSRLKTASTQTPALAGAAHRTPTGSGPGRGPSEGTGRSSLHRRTWPLPFVSDLPRP